MEKAGYVLLAILALIWFALIITGMVLAFPFGILGFIGIIGIGLLLIKVIKDRISSREDDYYDKNVHL
jgi:hypothetical protein